MDILNTHTCITFVKRTFGDRSDQSARVCCALLLLWPSSLSHLNCVCSCSVIWSICISLWLVWLSLFSILHSYVPWIPILSTSSPFLHIFASSTCMPHFMLSKPLQHFYNLCITMFKYWRLFNGHHSPKFILSFVFLCQMNNGPNSKIFFCLSFYIQANFWIQSWVILCPFFKQISEESFSMFPPFLSYFSFLLREKTIPLTTHTLRKPVPSSLPMQVIMKNKKNTLSVY